MNNLAILGGKKEFDVDIKEFRKHPIMASEEIKEVVELMMKNEISMSPLVREFEGEFASYVRAKYALAQNNGTSTLHAAYFAVGIGPGDEVLTPAYSWHLQCIPILASHGIPIFCDIDPKTLTILPEDIEKKINKKTKAIVVLHTYGHPVQIDRIVEIAKKHNLPVIEDCSHAHGVTYKGKHVGTFGDIGCFSLQGSKVMVAGEGGVLVTNTKKYYERAILLGHYERINELGNPEYKKYAYNYPQPPACFGFKYRIHPLASAIARVQLKKLPKKLEILRENMRYLSNKLKKIHPVFESPPELPGVERVWLNYICYYDEDNAGVKRDIFIEALKAEGLQASTGRAGYLPLYWNPIFKEKNLWGKGCPFSCPFYGKEINYPRGLCPNTERIWKREVGLPVFWNRTPREVLDKLIETIEKVLNNLGNLKKFGRKK